jgi:hypothetical protein
MNKTVQKLLQLGKLNFNSIGAIFKTDKCPDFYECNDGTFSTSNGRGACAGHGGLKNKPKRQAKKKSTIKQRIKAAAKKRDKQKTEKKLPSVFSGEVKGLMPGDFVRARMTKGKDEDKEYILKYVHRVNNELLFSVWYVKAPKIYDRVRSFGFIPWGYYVQFSGTTASDEIRVTENDYKLWCNSRKCERLDKLPKMLDFDKIDFREATKKQFDNRLLRLCDKSTFGSENTYQVYYAGRWAGSIVGDRSDAIVKVIANLPGLLNKEVVRKGCDVIPKSERQAATEETKEKIVIGDYVKLVGLPEVVNGNLNPYFNKYGIVVHVQRNDIRVKMMPERWEDGFQEQNIRIVSKSEYNKNVYSKTDEICSYENLIEYFKDIFKQAGIKYTTTVKNKPYKNFSTMFNISLDGKKIYQAKGEEYGFGLVITRGYDTFKYASIDAIQDIGCSKRSIAIVKTKILNKILAYREKIVPKFKVGDSVIYDGKYRTIGFVKYYKTGAFTGRYRLDATETLPQEVVYQEKLVAADNPAEAFKTLVKKEKKKDNFQQMLSKVDELVLIINTKINEDQKNNPQWKLSKTNYTYKIPSTRKGKYIKIDAGTSGKYMVEVATGNIYGIKAYGVIHKGHFYGNIEDFFNGNKTFKSFEHFGAYSNPLSNVEKKTYQLQKPAAEPTETSPKKGFREDEIKKIVLNLLSDGKEITYRKILSSVVVKHGYSLGVKNSLNNLLMSMLNDKTIIIDDPIWISKRTDGDILVDDFAKFKILTSNLFEQKPAAEPTETQVIKIVKKEKATPKKTNYKKYLFYNTDLTPAETEKQNSYISKYTSDSGKKAIYDGFYVYANLKNSIEKFLKDNSTLLSKGGKFDFHIWHSSLGYDSVYIDITYHLTDENKDKHKHSYSNIIMFRLNINDNQRTKEHFKFEQERTLPKLRRTTSFKETEREDFYKKSLKRIIEVCEKAYEFFTSEDFVSRDEIIKMQDEEFKKQRLLAQAERIEKKKQKEAKLNRVVVPSFIYLPITEKEYKDAYYNLVFNPEKLGKYYHQQDRKYMEDLYKELYILTEDDQEKIDTLNEKFSEFVDGYTKRQRKVLGTLGRQASSHVVGPARFPVAKMNKLKNIEQNQISDRDEYTTKKINSIKKYLNNFALYTGKVTKKDIQESDLIKEINKLYEIADKRDRLPGYMLTNAKQTLQAKIELQASKGNTDFVKQALDLMKQKEQARTKPVFTSRSRIWKAEAAATSKKEKIENTELKFLTDNYTNTKTGAQMIRVKTNKKLDDFKEAIQVAKNSGGYYSRYARGFLFKNNDDASTFISSMKDDVISGYSSQFIAGLFY